MSFNEDHPINPLFYTVNDPLAALDNCPALTTLWYKVLGKDILMFDEVVRLIELFMIAAYEKGKLDGE